MQLDTRSGGISLLFQRMFNEALNLGFFEQNKELFKALIGMALVNGGVTTFYQRTRFNIKLLIKTP